MKHAYLIMAHGNRKLLEILLELLDEKDNDIYLHIDAKSDIDPESFSGCVQRASLRCYKKIRVFWGDLSLTRCQFYLLKEAVRQHHDYYHLISGSDLPLKTCKEIEELFLRYKGRQFISFDSNGPSESENCKYLHPLRPLITRCKNRQSSLARGLHKMDEYFVDLQKKRGEATGLSRGSNWYDITHELAVDFVSHEKELLKAVRWAFPPDESVLQTYFRKYGGRFVLYGTEPDYERSILRKIDWQRGNGFSPYTWRSEDYEELMDSDMLFARKFDWDVDRNIILRIRETLLQRRNEEKGAIGEDKLKNFTVLEQSRFFIDLPESSQVMVLEATLSFIPDMALMKKACAKTLPFFPRFAGRAVIAADGKGVLLIRNTEDMPVSEEETPKELGTDETNHYLFRVIVSERRLTFAAYHSLGDGLLFVRFFVQLLSHYMKEAGEDIAVEEPILLQGKDFQALFETPEEGLRDVMAEAPKLPAVGRDDLFFDPRDDTLYGKRDFYTWRLLWDAGELKTVLSEYAVTPLVFFQVLISEILREQCAVGERVIEGGFAIDLHRRLHSRSQCEFGTLSLLHYPPEYDALSFEEKLLRTKKELDLRMELPAIRYELDQMNSYAADTLKYFDLRKPEVIRAFLRKREKGGSTFFISNLGRLMMPPELAERIIGINIYSPPAGYEGNYYLYSLADQSVLTYTGNSTSHQVMERLREKLEEHDVHSRAEIIGLKQTDYLGRLS